MSWRHGLLGTLLTAGLAVGPPASAAPITSNTALPVAEGQGIFRLQAKGFAFASDPSPLERDLEVRALPLVGAYGATRRLALFAVVPFVEKELTLNTPQGRRTRKVSGLGDVRLFARYTALQRDAPGRTFRIAPFLGVEAPTGSDDASDALGRLPQPLQPGSGSWDPFAGLVLTRQTLSWQADASVSYELNTTANEFEHGDEARLDLSYQHRAWPRRLEERVPGFLYAVLESNLIWRDRDVAAGVEDRDSGGTTWFLAPGVQYVTRRWVVEAAVQVPVAQELNGAALEADWILTLSGRVNL